MTMILREQFDDVLFRDAIDCGAKSLTSCRVKSVHVSQEKVAVHASEGKVIETKAVVGADGVNSVVARETGLNPRWPAGSLTACKVMEIPVSESLITDYYGEDKEYHFFANFGGRPGYGWVFPKIDTVNVGLGIVANAGGNLVGQFSLFVRMLQRDGLLISSALPDRARGALVPTAGSVPCAVADRVLLVGDSAGMVSPLTGGGIGYAMRAGKFAAIALARALEQDNLRAESLLTYERAWRHSFGRDIKRQLIAQKLFTSSFANTLFEIGHRDSRLQDMVAQLMSSGSTNATKAASIVGRVLWVCLREALH
jgi:digeranylgeranylglycerophospholipid reductase